MKYEEQADGYQCGKESLRIRHLMGIRVQTTMYKMNKDALHFFRNESQ